MENARSLLYNLGVVPVIRIEDASNAVPLAKALLEGEINAAEITFRTQDAAKAIDAIAKAFPEMYVCAGTILTVKQAQEAMAAGSKAIISPGTSLEVVDWCVENKIDVIPGCATPTEIQACINKGLDFVKLFPAEVVGGVKMLKALAGPFGQMKFMPTGGVSLQNLPEYLAQPNVVACGGTWIVPDSAMKNKDFDKITKLAAAAVALVKQSR